MPEAIERGELNLSLFKIEQEKADLICFREECETDEERAAVDQQIQEYVGREIRKVTGIAALLKYFKAMGAVAKAEKERLAQQQAKWEGRHERLRAMVLGVMQAMNVPKLEGATDRLRRQKNPVALEITDTLQIPEQYLKATIQMPFAEWRVLLDAAAGGIPFVPTATTFRVTSEVDTAAVKAALLVEGGVVPGARLVVGEHLRCE